MPSVCHRHNCSSSRPGPAAVSLPHSSTAWPAAAAAAVAQQRSWRCSAAAPEVSVLLEEPDIEFMGVLNDGMQTVRGVLHVAADADLVYNILTDYDSCARVFRNIADTKTVFTPEGGKQVVQACGWSFLAFKGTFDVALAVTEEPGQRLLVFRLVESSFMTDFEGRWQVSPSAPGCCRVEHVLAVKPLLAIPAAVAPYTSSIFKKQVALLLQDLQAEIERQAAAQAPGN